MLLLNSNLTSNIAVYERCPMLIMFILRPTKFRILNTCHDSSNLVTACGFPATVNHVCYVHHSRINIAITVIFCYSF